MTEYDPFADNAEDEAQAAPEETTEAPPAEPEPAPAKKAPAKKAAPKAAVTDRPVVAVGEGKIVTTLKGGAAFTDPWIVLHAESMEETEEFFAPENAQRLADLMKRVQAAGKHFVKVGGGAPASAGAPAQRQPAPRGATEPPAWAPPKPFDDFVYVTKVSEKTGRPWHAWMAPEKGDERKPLFFNPPR